MSKQTCYSIARSDDRLVVLGVEAGENDRWRISPPTSFTPEAGPPADLAKVLGKARQRVTWVLGEEEAGISTTAMPRLKPRQLKAVVKGWIVREQGGALDDWVVDWQPLDHEVQAGEPDKQLVAVAYAKQETVAEHAAAAGAWGVEADVMLPDYLALDLFFRRHGPSLEGVQGWNLVFVGRRQRFLCIGTGSHLLLTRTLPVDLSNGDHPHEYLDQLATEIERSAFFARQTAQSPEIEQIIICGDPLLAGNLTARLSSDATTPVQQWDLAQHFDYPDTELDPDLLLAAAAAALCRTKLPFNLAPRHRRTLFGPLARRRTLVAAGSLAMAAVPLLLIGGLLTTEVQERYLDRARERMGEAEIKAGAAADIYRRHGLLLAQEDYIRDITLATPDFEHALLSLANLTPKGIVYRDLQLRRGGSGGYLLRLSGICNASSSGAAQATFIEFLTALATCDFLVPMGEPSHMEITAQDDEGLIHKQVVFSLNYSVLPAESGVGG